MYVCVYAWQLLSNPTGPWELKSTRLHLRVTQPASASLCGQCLTGQWSMCVSTCKCLCLRVCVWVVSRRPNGLVVRMCLCRSVGVVSEFRFVCAHGEQDSQTSKILSSVGGSFLRTTLHCPHLDHMSTLELASYWAALLLMQISG